MGTVDTSRSVELSGTPLKIMLLAIAGLAMGGTLPGTCEAYIASARSGRPA